MAARLLSAGGLPVPTRTTVRAKTLRSQFSSPETTRIDSPSVRALNSKERLTARSWRVVTVGDAFLLVSRIFGPSRVRIWLGYTDDPRGCGGIGRRARFRSVWAKARGGSSPLIRIRRVRPTPRSRSPRMRRCGASFLIGRCAIPAARAGKRIGVSILAGIASSASLRSGTVRTLPAVL